MPTKFTFLLLSLLLSARNADARLESGEACDFPVVTTAAVDFSPARLLKAGALSRRGQWVSASVSGGATGKTLGLAHFATKRRLALPAGASERTLRFSPDEAKVFVALEAKAGAKAAGARGIFLDVTTTDPVGGAKNLEFAKLFSVSAVTNAGKIFGETSAGELVEFDPSTGEEKALGRFPARSGAPRGDFLPLRGESGQVSAFVDLGSGEIHELPAGSWNASGDDFAEDRGRVYHYPSRSVLELARKGKLLAVARDGTMAAELVGGGTLRVVFLGALGQAKNYAGFSGAKRASFSADGNFLLAELSDGFLRLALGTGELLASGELWEQKPVVFRGLVYGRREKGNRLELLEPKADCLAPFRVNWPADGAGVGAPAENPARELVDEIACGKNPAAASERAKTLARKASSPEGISPEELLVLLFSAGGKGTLGGRDIVRALNAAIRQQPAFAHNNSAYVAHALDGLRRADGARYGRYRAENAERLKDRLIPGRVFAKWDCRTAKDEVNPSR